VFVRTDLPKAVFQNQPIAQTNGDVFGGKKGLMAIHLRVGITSRKFF
jgi:hypothetical protein